MKARFYCENCGKEVPFNAEVCPYCGKIFEAVKCPICGYEGKPSEFSNGCPVCGYLSVNMNLEVEKRGKANGFTNRVNNVGGRSKIKISPLVFRITVIILLVILFFLIYLFFRV